MRYLFFDIECANNCDNKSKICEFGYCICDEKFNILEKDIFLINPKSEFEWFIIKKMLSYDKSIYEKSPNFKFYYQKIKQLITYPDQIIFGHSIDNDAKYLNDDCKRYRLDYLSYMFFDIREIFSELFTDQVANGLYHMCEFLGKNNSLMQHCSLDDALATMYGLQGLCEKTGKTPLQLIYSSENCKGFTHNGCISTVINEKNFERNC